MKYVVILGDGMADYPVDAFDGKTILEVADKPLVYAGLPLLSCAVSFVSFPSSDASINMSPLIVWDSP